MYMAQHDERRINCFFESRLKCDFRLLLIKTQKSTIISLVEKEYCFFVVWLVCVVFVHSCPFICME